MSNANADQQALIEQCRRGDGEAFAPLYASHAPAVTAYLLRSGFNVNDAQDLAQETFLRAFRSLGTFDPQRGTFRLWVGAIVRNVARRHWSRRSRSETFDPELADLVLCDDTPPGDDQAETNETFRALDDCVSALPADLQKIIDLRYVQGYTTRAVAETVEMPEATVRLRLTSAHGLIERCLKAKGIDP